MTSLNRIKMHAVIFFLALLWVIAAHLMSQPSSFFLGSAWQRIKLEPKLLGSDDPQLEKLQDDGAGSTGVYLYAFDDTTPEELHGSDTFPLTYKAGSPLQYRLRLTAGTSSTNSSRWCVEISLAKPGSSFPATSTFCVLCPSPGTAKEPFDCEFTAIPQDVTDMSYALRLYRDAGHTDDNYTGDIFYIDAGVRIQVDQIGARTMGSK